MGGATSLVTVAYYLSAETSGNLYKTHAMERYGWSSICIQISVYCRL